MFCFSILFLLISWDIQLQNSTPPPPKKKITLSETSSKIRQLYYNNKSAISQLQWGNQSHKSRNGNSIFLFKTCKFCLKSEVPDKLLFLLWEDVLYSCWQQLTRKNLLYWKSAVITKITRVEHVKLQSKRKHHCF